MMRTGESLGYDFRTLLYYWLVTSPLGLGIMENIKRIVLSIVLFTVSAVHAVEPPAPIFFGLTLEPAPPIAKEPAPTLFGLEAQEVVCENGVCRPVTNDFGLIPITPELPAPVVFEPTPVVSTPPVVSQPDPTTIASLVHPVAQPMSVPIYQTSEPVYYQTATPVYYQTSTPVYYEPIQVERRRFRPFRRFLERRRRIFRARWGR